ncbi:MAG: hypothetical protein IJU20_07355 [Clostridia bacterium]|nr:hypothetical protein [Clostridia bacterium]
MEVKTKVSSNLLIADGTSLENTQKAAENAFTSSLSQAQKGILEPVSTVNGKNFFYTTGAKADGSKLLPVGSEAYVQYDAASSATGSDAEQYADLFSQNYGLTKTDAAALYAGQEAAKAYVDYVFQLKAVNTAANAKSIKLTQLDLEYAKETDETDSENAFRVAVFANKFDANPTAGEGTLIGIYAPDGATNFTTNQAVASTTSLGSVNYNGATEVVEVAANSTEYFKVVVRLYIEGEDTTCKNDTFLALTGNWSLNLAFELDTTTNAVNSLTIKAAE